MSELGRGRSMRSAPRRDPARDAFAGLVEAGQAVLSRLPSGQARDVIRALEGRTSPVGQAIGAVLADASRGGGPSLFDRGGMEELVEEARRLLAQLPGDSAAEVIRALERPGSPLAEAVVERVREQMRQRAGDAMDEGLAERVSELVRSGREALSRLPEGAVEEVVGALRRGRTPIAASVLGGLEGRDTVLRDVGLQGDAGVGGLAEASRALLDRLPAGMGSAVVEALAGRTSPVAEALVSELGRARSLGALLADLSRFGRLVESRSGLFGGVSEELVDAALLQLPGETAVEMIRAVDNPSSTLDEEMLDQDQVRMQKRAGHAMDSDEGLAERVSELARSGQETLSRLPEAAVEEVEQLILSSLTSPSLLKNLNCTTLQLVQAGQRLLCSLSDSCSMKVLISLESRTSPVSSHLRTSLDGYDPEHIFVISEPSALKSDMSTPENAEPYNLGHDEDNTLISSDHFAEKYVCAKEMPAGETSSSILSSSVGQNSHIAATVLFENQDDSNAALMSSSFCVNDTIVIDNTQANQNHVDNESNAQTEKKHLINLGQRMNLQDDLTSPQSGADPLANLVIAAHDIIDKLSDDDAVRILSRTQRSKTPVAKAIYRYFCSLHAVIAGLSGDVVELLDEGIDLLAQISKSQGQLITDVLKENDGILVQTLVERLHEYQLSISDISRNIQPNAWKEKGLDVISSECISSDTSECISIDEMAEGCLDENSACGAQGQIIQYLSEFSLLLREGKKLLSHLPESHADLIIRSAAFRLTPISKILIQNMAKILQIFDSACQEVSRLVEKGNELLSRMSDKEMNKLAEEILRIDDSPVKKAIFLHVLELRKKFSSISEEFSKTIHGDEENVSFFPEDIAISVTGYSKSKQTESGFISEPTVQHHHNTESGQGSYILASASELCNNEIKKTDPNVDEKNDGLEFQDKNSNNEPTLNFYRQQVSDTLQVVSNLINESNLFLSRISSEETDKISKEIRESKGFVAEAIITLFAKYKVQLLNVSDNICAFVNAGHRLSSADQLHPKDGEQILLSEHDEVFSEHSNGYAKIETRALSDLIDHAKILHSFLSPGYADEVLADILSSKSPVARAIFWHLARCQELFETFAALESEATRKQKDYTKSDLIKSSNETSKNIECKIGDLSVSQNANRSHEYYANVLSENVDVVEISESKDSQSKTTGMETDETGLLESPIEMKDEFCGEICMSDRLHSMTLDDQSNFFTNDTKAIPLFQECDLHEIVTKEKTTDGIVASEIMDELTKSYNSINTLLDDMACLACEATNLFAILPVDNLENILDEIGQSSLGILIMKKIKIEDRNAIRKEKNFAGAFHQFVPDPPEYLSPSQVNTSRIRNVSKSLEAISEQIHFLVDECCAILPQLTSEQATALLNEIKRLESPVSQAVARHLIRCKSFFGLILADIPNLIEKCRRLLSMLPDEDTVRVCTSINESYCCGRAILFHIAQSHSMMEALQESVSLLLTRGQTLLSYLSDDLVSSIFIRLGENRSPLAAAIIGHLKLSAEPSITECRLEEDISEDFTSERAHRDPPESNERLTQSDGQDGILNLIQEGAILVNQLQERHFLELLEELNKMESPIARVLANLVRGNYNVISSVSSTIRRLLEEGRRLLCRLSDPFVSVILYEIGGVKSAVSKAISKCLLEEQEARETVKNRFSELIQEGQQLLINLSESKASVLVGELLEKRSLISEAILDAVKSEKSNLTRLSKNISSFLQQGRQVMSLISSDMASNIIYDLKKSDLTGTVAESIVGKVRDNQNLSLDLMALLSELIRDGSKAVCCISEQYFNNIMDGLLEMNCPLAVAIELHLCPGKSESRRASTAPEATGALASAYKDSDLKGDILKLLAEGRDLMILLPEAEANIVFGQFLQMDSYICKVLLCKFKTDLALHTQVTEMLNPLSYEGEKIVLQLQSLQSVESENAHSEIEDSAVTIGLQKGTLQKCEFDDVLDGISELVNEGNACLSLLSSDQAQSLIYTIEMMNSLLARSIREHISRLGNLISNLSKESKKVMSEASMTIEISDSYHIGSSEPDDGPLEDVKPQKEVENSQNNLQNVVECLVQEIKVLISLLSDELVVVLIDDLRTSPQAVARAILQKVLKGQESIPRSLDSISDLIAEGRLALNMISPEYSNGLIDELMKMNSIIALVAISSMLESERYISDMMNAASKLVREGTQCLSMLSASFLNSILENLETADRRFLQLLAYGSDVLEPQSVDQENALLSDDSAVPEQNSSQSASSFLPQGESDIFVKIWTLLNESVGVISRFSVDLSDNLIKDVEKMETPLAQYICFRLRDNHQCISGIFDNIAELMSEGMDLICKVDPALCNGLIFDLEQQSSTVAKAIMRLLSNADQMQIGEVKNLISSLIVEGENVVTRLSNHQKQIFDDVRASDSPVAIALRRLIADYRRPISDDPSNDSYESAVSNGIDYSATLHGNEVLTDYRRPFSHDSSNAKDSSELAVSSGIDHSATLPGDEVPLRSEIETVDENSLQVDDSSGSGKHDISYFALEETLGAVMEPHLDTVVQFKVEAEKNLSGDQYDTDLFRPEQVSENPDQAGETIGSEFANLVMSELARLGSNKNVEIDNIETTAVIDFDASAHTYPETPAEVSEGNISKENMSLIVSLFQSISQGLEKSEMPNSPRTPDLEKKSDTAVLDTVSYKIEVTNEKIVIDEISLESHGDPVASNMQHCDSGDYFASQSNDDLSVLVSEDVGGNHSNEIEPYAEGQLVPPEYKYDCEDSCELDSEDESEKVGAVATVPDTSEKTKLACYAVKTTANEILQAGDRALLEPEVQQHLSAQLENDPEIVIEYEKGILLDKIDKSTESLMPPSNKDELVSCSIKDVVSSDSMPIDLEHCSDVESKHKFRQVN